MQIYRNRESEPKSRRNHRRVESDRSILCHFFSNSICVRFMFLINMLNWICRVDTRGCKKRVSQEDWRNGMEKKQKDEREFG